jgi:branched-chain amino acid aminotransferase
MITVNASSAVVVFHNDHFLSEAEPPAVSLFDRGYSHGDAVFETLRAYRGRPFRLDAHLDRMFIGISTLGIACPLSRADIGGVVCEAIDKTGLDAVQVRVTVSRGECGSGIGTADCGRATVTAIARPFVGYPNDAYRHGIATSIVSARRIPNACIPTTFKSANYLPSVLARRELDSRAQLEGLVLSVDGEVVGGTVSNVFMVCEGELHTPALSSGCLPGVTRQAIIELAARLGVPVREHRLLPSVLEDVDELFFTNSLMELLPAAVVAMRSIAAPGPITRRLHAELLELIDSEVR